MVEEKSKALVKKIIFVIFFVSGFCGLLYQSVWLRLAFASFGINAQVTSIVISVFMLGLALGSWGMGSFISSFVQKHKINTLYVYAFAELGIGIGAFVVPNLFLVGRNWLLSFGETNSIAYLGLSALVIALIMLPWCFLMGTTIPLIIEFMRKKIAKDEKVFSYLYLANTIGAMAGVAISVFVLIESFGFRGTLAVAAVFNIMIFVISLIIAKLTERFGEPKTEDSKSAENTPLKNIDSETENSVTIPILFLTGFISMGLEVLWTRMYTPIIKTSVYAFAVILFLYLLGTCIGLWKYKYDSLKGKAFSTKSLVTALAFLLLIQIMFNDPSLNLGILGIVVSILGFSSVLGYLTPKQIDIRSRGDSSAVGKLYAINIIGCIIGPLVASYLLLPFIGAKYAIILFCIPLFYYLYILYKSNQTNKDKILIFALVILFASSFLLTTYEDGKNGPNKVILRDYSATVTAYKGEGHPTELLVNGYGMTSLNTITKVMAHLPLALLKEKANKVLTICFGMGTTYRSMMSWGLDTTAVELTPSVKELFPYFFADADVIDQNPNGRIVIDDGRRYLQRTDEIYDVIAIDPPPPVKTAGSSLLYSKEFYEIAIDHLSDNGILAQWYPEDYDETLNAVARSIVEVFPYAVVYKSVGGWGYHILASKSPINSISPEQFLKFIPPEAKRDLMEWNYNNLTDLQYAQIILRGKTDIKDILTNNKKIIVTDDQPFNEYYLLRKNGLMNRQ